MSDKEFNEDVERTKKLQSDRLFQLRAQFGEPLASQIFEREQKEKIAVEETKQKKRIISFESVKARIDSFLSRAEKIYTDAIEDAKVSAEAIDEQLADIKAEKIEEFEREKAEAEKRLEAERLKLLGELKAKSETALQQLRALTVISEAQINEFTIEAKRLLVDFHKVFTESPQNDIIMFLCKRKNEGEVIIQSGSINEKADFEKVARILYDLLKGLGE